MDEIPPPEAYTLDEPPVEAKRKEVTTEVRLLDFEELKAARANVRWLVKKTIPGNAIGLLFGG
jgi:hypothetical protein